MKSCNSLSQTIKNQDEKDSSYKAISVLQGFFHGRQRKECHEKNYPAASYETYLYIPKKMDIDLLIRVLETCDAVHFIDNVMHYTNLAYIDRLLDEGILSRRILDINKAPYKAAALSMDNEIADYDTVCLGIGDVDSYAFRNATASQPPVKITFDFKKLVNARCWAPGKIFIKEHDFLWRTKPNSTKYVSGFDEIPAEFAKIIKLGKLELQIYRHDSGVKFILDDKKYLLYYDFENDEKSAKVDKILRPKPFKLGNLGILEYVEDINFGQTIFYGDPQNIEKFFVMQFFRHIEKLPGLMKIIYDELKNLTNEEMLVLFKQIGKTMSCGAELNFHRGFYFPMEAIKSFGILFNFDFFAHNDKNQHITFEKFYSCNSFFVNIANKPVTIGLDDIIEYAKKNDADKLKKIIMTFQPLFQSARLTRYILSAAAKETETWHLLLAQLNDAILSDKHELNLPSGSSSDAAALVP